METLYTFSASITEHQILESHLVSGDAFTRPNDTKAFTRFKLGTYERSLWGDVTQQIEFNEQFLGTIDSA